MTFWQFLDKTLDRLPGWPDVRGWIMIALFMLTTQIVWMIYFRPNLAEIDLFKTIAQVLVVHWGVLRQVQRLERHASGHKVARVSQELRQQARQNLRQE